MKKIIVAIDGYASSGKSTMAKELARVTGYLHIDSGAMYRAVTLCAIQHGCFSEGCLDQEQLRALLPNICIDFNPGGEPGHFDICLNGINVDKDIRSMEVSEWVSPVATLPFVREELVVKQRAMGKNKGVVMDGRDIGTVVFPDAELKVFVTATPEIRARRRMDELRAKGEEVVYEEVLSNLKARDFIDSTRAVSPLRQAPDALVLDNSAMTPEEQRSWLLTQFYRVVRL